MALRSGGPQRHRGTKSQLTELSVVRGSRQKGTWPRNGQRPFLRMR